MLTQDGTLINKHQDDIQAAVLASNEDLKARFGLVAIATTWICGAAGPAVRHASGFSAAKGTDADAAMLLAKALRLAAVNIEGQL